DRAHTLGRGPVDQQAKVLAREASGHRIASAWIEEVVAHLYGVEERGFDDFAQRGRFSQPCDTVKAHFTVSLELPKGGDDLLQPLLGGERRFCILARCTALYDVVVQLNQVDLFPPHAGQACLDRAMHGATQVSHLLRTNTYLGPDV